MLIKKNKKKQKKHVLISIHNLPTIQTIKYRLRGGGKVQWERHGFCIKKGGEKKLRKKGNLPEGNG